MVNLVTIDIETLRIDYSWTLEKEFTKLFFINLKMIFFDSDIRLPAHLGYLLFTLYIRIYVLSFGYAILGFSSSHHQHVIKAKTPLATIIIIQCSHCHSRCPASSQSSTLSSRSSSPVVVAIKPLCHQPCGNRPSLCSV